MAHPPIKPSPKVAQLDPLIQQLFDDLIALMNEGYPNVSAFGNLDGAGTNLGVTVIDAAGNRDQYTQYRVGTRVIITPTGVSLGPGQTQQFTATATDVDGNAIVGATFDWALSAPAFGSVDATGLYTAPASILSNETDTIRATLSSGASWATIPVALRP